MLVRQADGARLASQIATHETSSPPALARPLSRCVDACAVAQGVCRGDVADKDNRTAAAHMVVGGGSVGAHGRRCNSITFRASARSPAAIGRPVWAVPGACAARPAPPAGLLARPRRSCRSPRPLLHAEAGVTNPPSRLSRTSCGLSMSREDTTSSSVVTVPATGAPKACALDSRRPSEPRSA